MADGRGRMTSSIARDAVHRRGGRAPVALPLNAPERRSKRREGHARVTEDTPGFLGVAMIAGLGALATMICTDPDRRPCAPLFGLNGD
jgi:hypothetical protein